MNLMLLSTELICSVKACASWVLIQTHKQGVVPLKAVKLCFPPPSWLKLVEPENPWHSHAYVCTHRTELEKHGGKAEVQYVTNLIRGCLVLGGLFSDCLHCLRCGYTGEK